MGIGLYVLTKAVIDGRPHCPRELQTLLLVVIVELHELVEIVRRIGDRAVKPFEG
jgi:hypothetical protein